ncbi:MAG: FHA domain-containing protein [Chloroflexota bacterium]
MQLEGDLWLLFLRFGMVVLLYLFLIQLAFTLHRSLAPTDQTARPASRGARLVVVESAVASIARGQVFPLLDSTSIGRAPGNDVKIDDPFLSARHAVITLDADANVVLEDLDSTNGTFVNRRQVAKPTLLQAGDIVQVGQVKLKIMR